jgi:type I restriction enzyme S subunit
VNYGYTASATAEPVGPKFLRITDIVPDVINWSSVPFCSIPENKKEQFLLKEGDVVVARTGATTGYAKRIGKTHPKTVFASYLIRLRLKSEIDDMLVGIFVESDDYKSYIKAQVGGAAQPNANAKIISSAKILIPPNNIQRYFHEMIEPIFECKDNLQAQNEKLTQARDLLLPRLMNGEIAV